VADFSEADVGEEMARKARVVASAEDGGTMVSRYSEATSTGFL